MATSFHEPVLVREVLDSLAVRPGGVFVDGTVGGGGHAAAILERSAPDGRLFGCDLDANAMKAAQVRLAPFAGRFEIREGSYTELAGWVPVAGCDGVLLDFGLSSHQVDSAERGFSVRRDGPLDMRFSRTSRRTAAQVVNEESVGELERILRELGGEPAARRLARAIDEERQRAPIRTTGQLAALAERVLPRRGARIHPATRLFQGLRMAVNRELETLREGLAVAWELLRPGGRLACLAFHGGEARQVKDFARRLACDYEVIGDVDVPVFRRPRLPQLRWVHRHAVRPTREESAANPRSRSALLYTFERLA